MAGTIKYEYSPLEDIFVIYSQAAEYRLKSSLSRSGYPPRVDGLGVGGGKVIYLRIDVLQTGVKLVYGINMENTDTTREFAATDVFGSLSEALVEYEHRVSGGGKIPVKTMKQYVYYAPGPMSIHRINHKLGREDVVVAVYDEHNSQILPHEINVLDKDNIEITFDGIKVRCKVVVVAGADFQSKKETTTNIPMMQEYVYRSYAPLATHTIKHGLNREDIGVFVYDENDHQIIPNDINIIDKNTVKIGFDGIKVTCKALIVAGVDTPSVWEVK